MALRGEGVGRGCRVDALERVALDFKDVLRRFALHAAAGDAKRFFILADGCDIVMRSMDSSSWANLDRSREKLLGGGATSECERLCDLGSWLPVVCQWGNEGPSR